MSDFSYTHHEFIRATSVWGTYGKSGNEPLKWIKIKDIHDDHLENIIIMMRENPRTYEDRQLAGMLSEQEYRRVKKIRVPFKFGH